MMRSERKMTHRQRFRERPDGVRCVAPARSNAPTLALPSVCAAVAASSNVGMVHGKAPACVRWHWHWVDCCTEPSGLGLVFCGAFTVTTTTEMLCQTADCFFSCLNCGRRGSSVVGFLHSKPSAFLRQVEYHIFITCEAYHWIDGGGLSALLYSHFGNI